MFSRNHSTRALVAQSAAVRARACAARKQTQRSKPARSCRVPAARPRLDCGMIGEFRPNIFLRPLHNVRTRRNILSSMEPSLYHFFYVLCFISRLRPHRFLVLSYDITLANSTRAQPHPQHDGVVVFFFYGQSANGGWSGGGGGAGGGEGG